MVLVFSVAGSGVLVSVVLIIVGVVLLEMCRKHRKEQGTAIRSPSPNRNTNPNPNPNPNPSHYT